MSTRVGAAGCTRCSCRPSWRAEGGRPPRTGLRAGRTPLRGLALSRRDAALLHTRAMLLLHDGRPRDAADTARMAIERADSVGAVIQSARSRALLGSALGRVGRREDAVALLREAEAELASYGAQRLRAEAARELRRLGRRPSTRQRRAAGGEGSYALSGREREIADLVAQGHTNRKIAAQLFLSEKTIESHLTSMFAKLGVASRAEVAERIGRSRPQRPDTRRHAPRPGSCNDRYFFSNQQ